MQRRGNKKQKQTKRRQELPGRDSRFDNRLLNMGHGGMPDSFTTTLEYTDVVKFSSNTSPYATYVFRGNSLYDPDYTGTGHQPLYFDTLMAVYSKYKVISVTVNISFIGLSGFCYVVPLSEILSSGPNVPTYAEYVRGRVATTGNAAIQPSRPIRAKYTTQSILGLTNQQLQDDTYSGTASTNPTSIWYVHLFFTHSDLVTNASMTAFVSLSFTSVFYDRNVITPSFKAPVPPPDIASLLTASANKK
jgi:hypothetical protein